MLAQQGGALADQSAALAGRHLGPGLLRRIRRFNRVRHVRGVPLGGPRHLLAGRRVDHGEAFAGAGRHKAAADQVLTGELAGQRALIQHWAGA